MIVSDFDFSSFFPSFFYFLSHYSFVAFCYCSFIQSTSYLIPVISLFLCFFCLCYFFDPVCLLLYYMSLYHFFLPLSFFCLSFLCKQINPVNPAFLVAEACFISFGPPVSTLLLTGLHCTCTASIFSLLYALLISLSV